MDLRHRSKTGDTMSLPLCYVVVKFCPFMSSYAVQVLTGFNVHIVDGSVTNLSIHLGGKKTQKEVLSAARSRRCVFVMSG